MHRFLTPALATALAFTVTSATAQILAVPQVQMELPARELAGYELGRLSGMPKLGPGNHPFEFVSMARVSAHAKFPSTQYPPEVMRRRSTSNAAVYASLPGAVPVVLPLPIDGLLSDFDFIKIGDFAQAWATTSTAGLTYLHLRAYGAASAEASTGWNTTVSVPAGGSSNEVVVRFVIPAATVSGDTKEQSIALWRSRLRADLMVNGYPAWSSQAMRLTIDPRNPSSSSLVETVVLQEFGSSWGFPTDDEDQLYSEGGPANDSPGNVNRPSVPRVVHLSLGRYAPGTVLNLSLVLHGVALTVPKTPGGTDNRCVYEARYFCSSASLTLVGGTGEPPAIYRLP